MGKLAKVFDASDRLNPPQYYPKMYRNEADQAVLRFLGSLGLLGALALLVAILAGGALYCFLA